MDNVLRHPSTPAHHGQPADDDGLNRHAPHDIEAEQIVLGGCMGYPHYLEDCAALIDDGDFFRPQHTAIWQTLRRLAANELPTDPVSVRIELERTKELDRAGGGDYLHEVYSWALPNPEYYAQQVAALARTRRHEQHATRIKAEIRRGTEPHDLDQLTADFVQTEQRRATGANVGKVEQLLAEMLSTDALDDMPTLEPLVGDLLHLDSLARIIGPSGHMKSFITIDFAAHVGTGIPWHGHHTRQGTVIYLVAEGARGIRKRVRAWEQHHGMKMTDVLFLPRPVQAMSPEWDTLIAACKRIGPALIVIDTQARVSVGVEENSAKELGLVIDRMEQLRAATAACVLVIHHTGHVGEHGRGSSSAKGALQSELHVSKKGDRASNIIVTVKTGKQKDDEEGGDLQFGLKVVTIDGEYKPDGRPVTSVVLESLDTLDRGPVPGTAEYIAAQLNQAGIPSHYGRDRLRSECARLGLQARTELLAEVARIRKHGTGQNTTSHLSPNLSPTETATPVPIPGTGTDETPAQTCPGQVGDSTGQAVARPVPMSPPLGGGQGDGQPTSHNTDARPQCTVCHTPMDPEWHHRGYDTHIGCDPHTNT